MILALRLLWRNWRGGEIKILSIALILAVSVVSSINVFTLRLEEALIKESNSFLGADRIIRSSQPFEPKTLKAAEQFDIRQAFSTLFSSMMFAGDNMHLASVKAVTSGYPLAGKLEISDIPFALNPADISIAHDIPAPGTVWVDSRLLPLLQIELGDQVHIGEKLFDVTRVVIREPDRSDGFSLLGPRVLMNATDLPATEIIQPGSRVRYQWLIAADTGQLESFIEWLKPNLTPHQKIIDLQSAQRGLSTTLTTGTRFLLLAGVIGVLLAGVAIAIAAQRFSERQVDQVALMKSLGGSAWQVRRLYIFQLLFLALITSATGLILGELFQRGLVVTLSSLFPVKLDVAPLSAYLSGVLTGLVCTVFFAIPPLWHLPTVPPLKVLRRELGIQVVKRWTQGGLGVCAVLVLIGVFSGDFQLTVSVAAVLAVIVFVCALIAQFLLRIGRFAGGRAGSVFRLALADLQRRKEQSTTQILVFAIALLLLFTLFIVRTSLIDEWKVQLPKDAPNHFLVNIAPYDIAQIQALAKTWDIKTNALYPMVRGRLTHINGIKPDRELEKTVEVLRREANLSWTDTLADDNKILSGQWWDSWPAGNGLGVSVEQQVAEGLGLVLGDKLQFSIGGLKMQATVASIRSLEWDSMRPNFYFLFSPGALDSYSPVFLTSLYLPPEKKLFINELLIHYPTVLVIEMDRVIEQIRTIINQVSSGVELVLWLVVCGGLLVLVAAVNASMDSRIQEAALLRAFGGSSKQLLGSVWVEFSVLGLFSGVIAVLGTEVFLLSLQQGFLGIEIQPHYFLWASGPLMGALAVGVLGIISCRRTITVSPGAVLRETH